MQANQPSECIFSLKVAWSGMSLIYNEVKPFLLFTNFHLSGVVSLCVSIPVIHLGGGVIKFGLTMRPWVTVHCIRGLLSIFPR